MSECFRAHCEDSPGLFVIDQRLVLNWQGLAQSTKAGATLLDNGGTEVSREEKICTSVYL